MYIMGSKTQRNNHNYNDNGSKGKGRMYTVSRTPEGMWYCHMRGYSYIPVSGSFCEKKSDAMEYAKAGNGLPNKVDEIESRKRAAYEKEMEEV